MPKALEAKLKREYPNNPHAVYGTLNRLGYMHGNQVTPAGAALETQGTPPRKMKAVMMKPRASHPGRNLGKHLSPRKSR